MTSNTAFNHRNLVPRRYRNSNRTRHSFDNRRGNSRRVFQNDNTLSSLQNDFNTFNISNHSFVPPHQIRGLHHIRGGRRFVNRSRNRIATNDDDLMHRLLNELSNQTYECMVCCEIIKREVPVWNCKACYNVFHLRCIQDWAVLSLNREESHQSGNNWRCPACQNEINSVPEEYECFCGKVRNPEYVHGDTPHSCGEMCSKRYRKPHCPHPCTLLCHPGPCPPCNATITRLCDCSKEMLQKKCDKAAEMKCSAHCNKTLLCNRHKCEVVCHSGDCPPCKETAVISCYCNKSSKEGLCSLSNLMYSCGEICEKPLQCLKHKCSLLCHSGECKPCDKSPNIITSCPCGKMKISLEDRSTCDDPIPLCGEVCDKILVCGGQDKRHRCQALCHYEQCPVCPNTTKSRCFCGANTVTVDCVKIQGDGRVLCSRACKKKLHCGRHQCKLTCCRNNDHICYQMCNKMLNCGIHRCDDICHEGGCQPCLNSTFDELTCTCGRTVLEPPIRCGTKRPVCQFSCTIPRNCGHPVAHACHYSDTPCPPCSQLVEQICLGGHQSLTVPCSVNEVACSRICNKKDQYPNCDHLCMRTCHKGRCVSEEDICKQLCTKHRPICSHPCNEPCHGRTDCPATICKSEIPIFCECKRISNSMPCYEYQRASDQKKSVLVANLLKSGEDDEVDLTSIDPTPYLDCNDFCRREQWLRKLDDAFGPPEESKFNDWILEQARENPAFVSSVETEMKRLVDDCIQTNSSCQHEFKRMNYNKRRLIHELAEHYGLDSQSLDREANRHVTVYAFRSKVKSPSISLTATSQKKITRSPVFVVSSSQERDARAKLEAENRSTVLKKNEIQYDYFDM